MKNSKVSVWRKLLVGFSAAVLFGSMAYYVPEADAQRGGRGGARAGGSGSGRGSVRHSSRGARSVTISSPTMMMAAESPEPRAMRAVVFSCDALAKEEIRDASSLLSSVSVHAGR